MKINVYERIYHLCCLLVKVISCNDYAIPFVNMHCDDNSWYWNIHPSNNLINIYADTLFKLPVIWWHAISSYLSSSILNGCPNCSFMTYLVKMDRSIRISIEWLNIWVGMPGQILRIKCPHCHFMEEK